ncbi:unnamed protein product [Microthlaspi erraticum]|uniref:TF-B3 domain-containing protein n=1 Tax=Microthlaspi erraticum TaxID=1685480 RepID=A0A6D2HSK7_9BRAS|nr:unnamed protein product [Microthlaspi erraticum]
MAESDLPRFFKVFISRFYSDSLQIPISYHDQLPHPLPKTATLQGNGGCFWKVSMIQRRDEVFFEQGWSKFVEDNSLADGDFLTFVYNGDSVFEVSTYDGRTACKVIRARATAVEDDKDDEIYILSSGKDTDSGSESETIANEILRSKEKGKSKVEDVEESDEKEDSDAHVSSEDTDETCSESKMSKAVAPSRRVKGNKKVVVESDEGSDSDDEEYVEAFGRLDVEESSKNSDTSYDPDSDDTANNSVKNKKKKGKSKVRDDVDSLSDGDGPGTSGPKRKRGKVDPRIKDPERFLADPMNIHFETILKNRKHELLVHAQIVRDYYLEFKPTVDYMDNHKDGKLVAKAIRWADSRVCIKKWKRICERNKVKENDAILCELLRRGRTVYAVRVHIVREADL